MESLEYLSRVRRDLHRIPELSHREFKTSDYIAAELTAMGHKFRRVLTGIICDVAGVSHSKRIALRADIDALPIEEKAVCDFKSTNGCMHACGHDGHMAMLLETARVLASNKAKCDVRLIFQFAEEGSGGAVTMIEEGAIKNVDQIYALHMCPELKIGEAATSDGALFAGAVEFDVGFSGKASHCASKSEGIDALKAANYFVTESDKFNSGYKGNTLFHIGKMTAGVARNVVASSALVECTLRYFDSLQQEAVMMNIATALANSDNLFLTDHRLTVHAVYPPLINSGEAVKEVKRVFPNLKTAEPKYTAEDFAFYTEKISGCMTWLGCGDDNYHSPLHADTFGFDDKAMLTGADIFKKIIF